jgi:DNA polymerase-3 subunit delta'
MPSVQRQPSTVNREPPTVIGFRDLIGQERAMRVLQRGIATGRTAHAYLFAGPEGIGKRTAALALAQALNCQQGDAVDDGCGICQSCRKITRGLHPDVQVVEPEGATLKIDQIRTLEADAAMRPYEGRRKVFILQDADKITEQAANALLKTLEEPPGWTVLVLLASTPSSLPLTIVSRCQIVIFSTIGPDALEAYLVARGIGQDQARLIVSCSGGSIGRALRQGTAAMASSRDLFLAGLERGFRDGPSALIDLAEREAKDREGLRHDLECLSAWVRDLMIAKVSGRRDWLINQDRREEIARQAEGLPLNAILDALRIVHGAMDGLTRSANPRLSLEDLLLQLRETVSTGLVQVPR